MSQLRRSVSLPSLQLASARDHALHVRVRYIQSQARALLATRKLKEEQQAAQKRETDLEENMEAVKNCLGNLRNRIAVLEHIKQRDNLLHEQGKIVDDLEAKINKTEKGDIENLIAFLNSTVSKLLVENVVLPKTEAEKGTCESHIKETLKTLSECDQLKSNNNFDVKKLVILISELELLNVRTQKTATNCVVLEEEMQARVLEHNGKKSMLEMKKRHKERK